MNRSKSESGRILAVCARIHGLGNELLGGSSVSYEIRTPRSNVSSRSAQWTVHFSDFTLFQIKIRWTLEEHGVPCSERCRVDRSLIGSFSRTAEEIN